MLRQIYLLFFKQFTGKSKFSQASSVLEAFENYLASTNIYVHFDGIAEIPASRALKEQLRLIHKESGIHVLLLVDNIAVTEVPKIIRDFIAIKPICELFSSFVWIKSVQLYQLTFEFFFVASHCRSESH